MAVWPAEQLKQFELPNVKFTGKKLGEGSYGSVEVVEIPGALCAAKTVHEILVQSVGAQQRSHERRDRGYVPRSIIEGFVTECTLMSTLRHPHIVQFLGICYPPDSQLPALVMELLMTSLHKMLESIPDIPMSIKHSILCDVARGLVYLHSLVPPVIHRDLTASNVLLDSSLTAKIADLGMARLLHVQASKHAATMTKGPGNASYMPPEAKLGDDTKYGKPIDTFSMGHLILFTGTQEFTDLEHPTYYDVQSGTTKALTEVERRENSFRILWQMFGKEHPLVLLANQCLQDNPRARPTAPEILQQLEAMQKIPHRNWNLSKLEFIQYILNNECTAVEVQQQNVRLVSEHARSVQENEQTIAQLRCKAVEQEDLLFSRDAELKVLHAREKALLEQLEQMRSYNVTAAQSKCGTSSGMCASTVPSPSTLEPHNPPSRDNIVKANPLAQKTDISRGDIVEAILSIRIGPGQPLRQVQVPPEVYQLAKKFVVKAPNILGGSEPYRFKVLWYIEGTERSIYGLLITDAANTTLDGAEAKIREWRDAIKALLRYALNLLLAPKHPEFQRVKLSSSYYVYQVANKFKGADKILVSMGYERVAEVQELKYKGEVNNSHIAETAADLVILDGELERVKGLVTHFLNESNRVVILTHILQARTHPTETFAAAEFRVVELACRGSFRNSPVVHQHSAATSTPGYIPSPRLEQRQQPQQYLQQPNQYHPPQPRSMPYNQSHLEPVPNLHRRESAPGHALGVFPTVSQPAVNRSGYGHGGLYNNLPLDSDIVEDIKSRQVQKEAEQQIGPTTQGSGDYVNFSVIAREIQRQEKPNASSDKDYMNFPNTSNKRQPNNPYSEVTFDRGIVNMKEPHPSIPPDPHNLPEPIAHDEADLGTLQSPNTGEHYHTISLITDARSDPVGFHGPSFDSLMSLQSQSTSLNVPRSVKRTFNQF